MKLYFLPFACSLASRIALIEAELDAEFVAVAKDKLLPDGRALADLNPMNMVPVLEMRDGAVLTENHAILTYIADLAAEGALAPAPYTQDRYRMIAWLNFIGTELHASIFHPLFTGGEAVRPYTLGLVAARFGALSAHLDGRAFLVGETFTVADAYLVAVLNWCEHAGVAIGDWPVLLAWRTALRRRPAVAQAMAEELPLLQAA